MHGKAIRMARSAGSKKTRNLVFLHPRLIGAAALALIVSLSLWAQQGPLMAALLGWNAGCWCWVALIGWMMRVTSSAELKKAADEEDVGAWLVLFLVCTAATVSVIALVFAVASHAGDRLGVMHYLLAASTVGGSWIAVGLVFACHYARLYYSAGAGKRPLLFPGELTTPGYADFLYFAFTISVAAQTSDVVVATTNMRKFVLVHSVLGFFFNAAIIGLSINVFAGGIGR